jgi:predicted transcriptional regulator
MSTVRRTLELDPDTDARLSALAAEKGKDASAVVADALILLDSVVELEGLDIEEDQLRLAEFERTGQAVLLGEVKAWVGSWGKSWGAERPRRTLVASSLLSCVVLERSVGAYEGHSGACSTARHAADGGPDRTSESKSADPAHCGPAHDPLGRRATQGPGRHSSKNQKRDYQLHCPPLPLRARAGLGYGL